MCRLVMARPQGQRCLVIASNQRTVSRTRTGAVLQTFTSALPGGSPATGAPADAYSILDCVLHEPDRTLYVLDLMCWAGYLLYDCSAEFRTFWACSKLAELDAAAPPTTPAAARHCFRPVLAHPCNQGQLSTAQPCMQL
jgi:snurportin-1